MQAYLDSKFAGYQTGARSSITPQRGGLVAPWSSKDADVTNLPDPNAIVLPPIKWGRVDVLFTPAYWAFQANLHPCPPNSGFHRLGKTFREEVVACLLGGYGIPADVGIAAFHALRDQGLLAGAAVSEEQILRVLNEPICLRDGKRVRYRFAGQKSKYIAAFLAQFREVPATSDMKVVRDWLMRFDGIGPKTASWIVRNWFDSDDVAIIDVHLFRAGLLAGFFGRADRPDRDYRSMEGRYLAFAEAIHVRASVLDALIWWQMRRAGRLVLRALQHYNQPIGNLS